MQIPHPRRLLLLGAPSPDLLTLTAALTGSAPAPHSTGSCAGLTHEWEIHTPYYTAKVPVWLDEIGDLEEWKEEFLREEAGEVVRAVGAWVYVFRLEGDGGVGSHGEAERVIGVLREVGERHGEAGESVRVAVGVPSGEGLGKETREMWDDVAMEAGFEFVEFGAEGKNEFGEKLGVERLREALEANEWADEDGDGLGFDGGEEDGGFGDFGHEEAEMTAELFGLKAALLDQDEDDAEEYGDAVRGDLAADDQKAQVDDLDRMMSKLLAVREQSADLPEAQRKRMAAKAVRELMGDDDSAV